MANCFILVLLIEKLVSACFTALLTHAPTQAAGFTAEAFFSKTLI
jgi:hypothetical protein